MTSILYTKAITSKFLIWVHYLKSYIFLVDGTFLMSLLHFHSLSDLQKFQNLMSLLIKQDKLGPFCRSAADCAIILDNIRGKDPDDLSSRDMPFGDPFAVDLTKLTVGYLNDSEEEV